MQSQSPLRIFISMFISLCLGVALGGLLFSDSRPRSFIAPAQCRECLRPADLAGLIASVGIQKLPSAMPLVVHETDKTIVIKHPMPLARVHYVLIPKKDILNAADLSQADGEYLKDVYFVAGELIRKEHLRKYRLYTNGPGLQDVTYLHFHLLAR